MLQQMEPFVDLQFLDFFSATFHKFQCSSSSSSFCISWWLFWAFGAFPSPLTFVYISLILELSEKSFPISPTKVSHFLSTSTISLDLHISCWTCFIWPPALALYLFLPIAYNCTFLFLSLPLQIPDILITLHWPLFTINFPIISNPLTFTLFPFMTSQKSRQNGFK